MANIKFDFSKKRVLITGAGQGIGHQMMEDFLSADAEVIIWEQAQEHIEKLKKHPLSSRLSLRQVDVSSKENCETAAASLKEPIDFLINNAGIVRDRSFSKMTEEEYSSVINTNLNAVFYVTKALMPHFKADSSQKRIINLSSFVALYGNFGQSNYVAAKAGVIGLTKVWSKELAKKGWTVNAIAPGFIDTSILKNMPENIIKAFVDKIPVGRLGHVEDISKTCLFLCSKEASYINGSVIEVTGGVLP